LFYLRLLESVQVSEAFDGARETEQHRLLKLQSCLLSATFRGQFSAHDAKVRAFYRMRLFAERRMHAQAAEVAHRAHNERTAQALAEASKASHQSTEVLERQIAALRSEAAESSLRCTQLQVQCDAARVELEAERDKCNVLKLAHGDVTHTFTAAQEHAQRVQADLQLQLQTAQASEQRYREKQELILRELESALSESTATITKLRMEVSLAKEQVVQGETKLGALQTAYGATQYEKSELYAKTLTFDQQSAALKAEFTAQLDALRMQNAAASNELGIKNKELSLRHEEHQELKHHSEKIEGRLRALMAANEALKGKYAELKTENGTLRRDAEHNVGLFKQFAAEQEKLQGLLKKLRSQECEKCLTYERQLEAVKRERAEDLRVFTAAQAESKASKETIAQLHDQVGHIRTAAYVDCKSSAVFVLSVKRRAICCLLLTFA
jgi:chromosome segregation ATPase